MCVAGWFWQLWHAVWVCAGRLTAWPARAVQIRECNGWFSAGPVPAGIDPTQRVQSDSLYALGTSPDFETLVEDGGMTCNAAATTVDGAIDEVDHTEEPVLASFVLSCAEMFENIHDALLYPSATCSKECIDYLANLGACGATELSEVCTDLRPSLLACLRACLVHASCMIAPGAPADRTTSRDRGC